jgi:hypothetical protein
MIPRPFHKSPKASPRRGGVPLWMPIALVVLLVGFGAILLERSATRRGVALVDLTRYRLHHGDRWFSPDWRDELEDLLLRGGSLLATDLDAREALKAEVLDLPFVAAVEEGELLWPAGLTLRVRLIEPIACVRVGQEFLPVGEFSIRESPEAESPITERVVLLPGWSDVPHKVGLDFLPVLQPTPFEWEVNSPKPGELIDYSLLLSALSMVRSFREHLTEEERSLFGRVVFDVSAGTAPDGLEGGAVLYLEGKRVIVFGDASAERGPGELPDSIKWGHALEGVLRTAEGVHWSLLDVRFDRPEYDGESGK